MREALSALAWGAALPLLIVGAAVFISPMCLAAVAAYPIQMLRIYLHSRGPRRARLWRAVFLVVGKFAEAFGEAKFLIRAWSGGPRRLIEYK